MNNSIQKRLYTNANKTFGKKLIKTCVYNPEAFNHKYKNLAIKTKLNKESHIYLSSISFSSVWGYDIR